MYNIPAMYDYANAHTSTVNPSTVHVSQTGLARFFKRHLFQRAISVFDWELPETWSRDYFLYVLYYMGYIGIIETDKYGVIPQMCGLMGYNVFYQPNKITIANPLIGAGKIVNPTIDENCVVLKLMPDYGGIYDIVDFYGDMMALAAETAGTNLLNSKLAYVFTASNKASAESFKKLYDTIAGGNPAAVYDKNLLNTDGTKAWDAFTQNLGQNYITDKLLADLRKLENMFDTKIGIPNANTDKTERLIVDEVNSNNVETFTTCDMWLEELQQGCRKVRDMFGVEIGVDWRVKPDIEQEGGAEDEI